MKQKPLKAILVLTLMISFRAASQQMDAGWALLQQLDSIRQTSSAARPFAELYFLTTARAIRYADHRSADEKQFLESFEERFAGFFLEAARAAEQHDPLPPVWAGYFTQDTLHPVRLQLLGINAHINGDIWKALTQTFTAAELHQYKHCYRAFNRDLKKVFDTFYDQASVTDVRFAVARELSPGLTHGIGHHLLTRWRKRQYKLAQCYFSRPARFRKMFERVSKKRESLNRLICNHF